MDYKNVKEQYSDTYKDLTYGDGYLIGLHGIQTALYMQDYNNITENININDIKYGYYDSSTEQMVKQFQINNNIFPTGILTQETWDAIFNGLLETQGVILSVTGEKELTIIDIYDVIDNKKENIEDLISGGIDFSGIKDYNYVTGDGSKNFNSSGECTTERDTLGGENYASNTNEYVIGNRDNIPTINYNDDKYNNDNGNTSYWNGSNIIDGKKYFNELQYGYYTNGGKSLTPNYAVNIPNTNRWNGTTVKDVETENYQKDYDFIYNLLSNTLYNAGGYTNALKTSNSTTDTLVNYSGDYEESSNKPFFSPDNILTLRRSRFDIDLVYGAKGQKSRRIVNVIPMSVSQQVNASGEPIYDVYEFIAQDVIYSDN